MTRSWRPMTEASLLVIAPAPSVAMPLACSTVKPRTTFGHADVECAFMRATGSPSMQADTTDQVPVGSPPDAAYATEQWPEASGMPKVPAPVLEAEGPQAGKETAMTTTTNRP